MTQPRFPGDPGPGRMHLGQCGIVAPIEQREAALGRRYSIRRTYYKGDGTGKAVAHATAELAAGRLPWLSFKPPATWVEAAAGAADGWAADLGDRLAGLGGPVWVSVWHEPETDGDPVACRGMWQRLLPLLRRPNVATSVVLSAYRQVVDPLPGFTVDDVWPGDALVDIVALDRYNPFGKRLAKGGTSEQWTELAPAAQWLAAWAGARGKAFAFAEIGFTGAAAERDPAWLERACDDAAALGAVAVCYFDSEQGGSEGDYPLTTPAKIAAMASVLARPYAVS